MIRESGGVGTSIMRKCTVRRLTTNDETPGATEQSFVLKQRFGDLDQLANTINALGAWELELIQLDQGRFSGELQQIVLGPAAIGRLRLGRSIHQRGAAPRGFLTFGIPASHSPEFFMGERPSSAHVLRFPRAGEFDAVADAGFDAYPVSFSLEHLARLTRRLGLPDVTELASSPSVQSVPESALDGIRRHLRRLLQEGGDVERLGANGFRDAVEFELPKRILTALASSRRCKPPRVRLRDQAIRRSMDYIAAADGQPVTVRELCREVRVSWRTLNYAFRERFEVTPKAYLNAVRLNGARKDLRNADPDHKKVAEVANRWGFWHMGQFAADYRRLFRELPSETLSRKSRDPADPRDAKVSEKGGRNTRPPRASG
jgi:AraC-like DNA-binding protein